jgi:hypothetical protein
MPLAAPQQQVIESPTAVADPLPHDGESGHTSANKNSSCNSNARFTDASAAESQRWNNFACASTTDCWLQQNEKKLFMLINESPRQTRWFHFYEGARVRTPRPREKNMTAFFPSPDEQ